MKAPRVPDVVVRRLALYLRVLNEMITPEEKYVSSQQLGDLAGVTSAQVRKDLAMFGEFGRQGVGYEATFLRDEVAHILRADRTVNFCVVGAGELGTALARYTEQRREAERAYAFRLAALFDISPAKVGRSIDDTVISHLDDVEEVVRGRRIKIAILTVPASAAQEVASILVSAGIKSILNFVPVKLKVPEGVRVNNMDVTVDLHELAFFL